MALQVEENICPSCAATARTGRKIADRDEKHREKHKDAPAGAPLPSDGLHVHLRALSPQEAAAKAKKAKGGPADG